MKIKTELESTNCTEAFNFSSMANKNLLDIFLLHTHHFWALQIKTNKRGAVHYTKEVKAYALFLT